MPTRIVVPEMGESVVSAIVARWLKEDGEAVARGEAVVELETEKVNLEVAAEAGGILAIAKPAGAEVQPGDVLGTIAEAAVPVSPATETAAPEGTTGETRPGGAPAAKAAGPPSPPEPRTLEASAVVPVPVAAASAAETPAPRSPADARGEERVPMSRRRQTIARRLVESLRTAAVLTTFNEVDMGALQELRTRLREVTLARHGLFPGLTAFFIKAAVGALKAFPRLNAEIRGEEMVLKHYYDIGVAVGAEEGLVVPVIRDADRLGLIEIERAVTALAQKTADQTLTLADLRGGTFTITNGGVFGSLLSTPILNSPQVGILGLHKIEARPVVRNGQVVVQPMMYVALSYDHRIVDGREAVQFLVRVKELIEDPVRFLLEN
ncbi:MAG: dihydrolipoyllysine-residue succinyltransferase [Zetaproteobacteria bacterium]|nr:MAG: dihydrolipoyllysine-residue succinyltransferase [Zetaproteobacteria bacterium]